MIFKSQDEKHSKCDAMMYNRTRHAFTEAAMVPIMFL